MTTKIDPKLILRKEINPHNKVNGRCSGCKHYLKGYSACSKAGTCVFDLVKYTELATEVK